MKKVWQRLPIINYAFRGFSAPVPRIKERTKWFCLCDNMVISTRNNNEIVSIHWHGESTHLFLGLFFT